MSRLTDFFPSSSGGGGGTRQALLIAVGGGEGSIGPACSGTSGGHILCTRLNISTGTTYPIIIGAGGASPGGAGGYSSFDDLVAWGGSQISSFNTPLVRGLPLKYPGYMGIIPCTILYSPINIRQCASGCVPFPSVVTVPAPFLPTCPTTLSTSCRITCSAFYNVDISNQPYTQNVVSGGPVPVRCFPVFENSIGCSRLCTGTPTPGSPPSCSPCPGFYNCFVIPNNPNTGHGGLGGNGDSGVVVLFYPSAIPAASSFPGGIDCTPVSFPFGMRAYKFTSSGSITI